MTIVIWVCAAMLAVAAALVVTRMTLGPTMLNRVVAMDVLIAIVVAGLGLEAALNQHTTTLPILVVLSLVGFVGSVSVARFAARDDKGERA
ncbi:monovalent cation/H+ antiporter complex subunit F [Jiangella gansuensis]|uniref:monovalent cation/H+ antiporter complex subunit F n=1 Tax=Jiangella gansuensis TaxID=281473 RepID=UPI00047BB6D7|nr:monovalent cation/H+ antiporter complex subunit F [Jiangella gansuensis]